ncbi:hypothetical protein E0H26_18555 [Micromonospora zingiberis]|uniref:Uncharacterized protein n=1 Tax=Micromonospora zingiberis TaxID=2053011 RepID=A0A4R0GEV0_9ACTN|nr:hypothetical protein [Micromonospora zingiberis]TCB95804.1 hypothetical protein E0H26_18555 [Micromonospora zingiberis]
MHEDASPFFIAPHRFDAVDDDSGPILDRRHELVPDGGERILGQHQLDVAGYLLGPTEARHTWTQPGPVTLTITDHRLVYVGAGSQLAMVGARHRRGARRSALVSGQVRWQWPSRLESLPSAAGGPARLLVVCDALRTIQQPALAMVGPDAQVERLSQEIRRAVATFRLTRPELVDLSPPERDALSRLTLVSPRPGQGRVILPGSLPVEFHSRDDYYRPRNADQMPYGAASGQR